MQGLLMMQALSQLEYEKRDRFYVVRIMKNVLGTNCIEKIYETRFDETLGKADLHMQKGEDIDSYILYG